MTVPRVRSKPLSRTLRRRAFLAVFLAAGTAEAGVTKGPYLQDVRSNEAEVRIEVSPPTAATLQIFSPIPKDAGASMPVAVVAHAESPNQNMHALRVGG